ncbi:MAG: hypothetical protein ABI760_16950 [Ferruginibacter sp.]
MGYATKVQCIKRAASEQWYVNFPAAVAQALELQQGEIVEWLIDDHQNLALKRSDQAVSALKKKTPGEEKILMEKFNELFDLCRKVFIVHSFLCAEPTVLITTNGHFQRFKIRCYNMDQGYASCTEHPYTMCRTYGSHYS